MTSQSFHSLTMLAIFFNSVKRLRLIETRREGHPTPDISYHRIDPDSIKLLIANSEPLIQLILNLVSG